MSDDETVLPDLSAYPRRVDRKTGAKLITELFFRVSPRTLETWPLEIQQINGRAHCRTVQLFACAQAKLLAAGPPRLSGRRPNVKADSMLPGSREALRHRPSRNAAAPRTERQAI